eukprot:9501273-Pyramimonas_sp.AAC.1
MLCVYLEARGNGSDEADSLQCVASGFDEEISNVVERLAQCAEHLANYTEAEDDKHAYCMRADRWRSQLAQLRSTGAWQAGAIPPRPAAAGLLQLEAHSPATRSIDTTAADYAPSTEAAPPERADTAGGSPTWL